MPEDSAQIFRTARRAGTAVSSEGEAGRRPAVAGRGGHARLAFDDPLSALPDSAQRLLLAAKDIIETDGFSALTLNAVSAASGENIGRRGGPP